MSSSAGNTVQRKDPCQAAGTAASWTVSASSNATPGNAAGTNNFVYELVELHNDN